MTQKPKILTLCDFYRPGFKAGGPITTISNMVARLGPDFEFRVIARDRDLGDQSAYPDLVANTWHDVGGTAIRYLSPGRASMGPLAALLADEEYDVVYLNSFFSPLFSIWPLMLRSYGQIPYRPVVLAPRGELSPGALHLKRAKKRVFLHLSRRIGLHRNVYWQASTAHEASHIRTWFGDEARITIARDLLPAAKTTGDNSQFPAKRQGSIRLLFLSRIDRMKNLDGLLKTLQRVAGQVELSIAGPVDDEHYWLRCQHLIQRLPATCTVHYLGPVSPHDVPALMQQHDLFCLPSLGENFGHVIAEALSAGCPVLISDRTPWRDLEQAGVGWDFPLDRPEMFREVLAQCIAMGPDEHRQFRVRAQRFIAECRHPDTVLEDNRDLFLQACFGFRPSIAAEAQPLRQPA